MNTKNARDAVDSLGGTVAASPPSRLGLLELGRWVAIYAIVWLHTVRSDVLEPSKLLARFAVPFFVAACVWLIFLSAARNPQRTFFTYARNRFVRIYVPFLAWCAVYLGFKVVKGIALPDQLNEYPFGPEILWTGTFIHMWFMPFILLVSLATFPIAKAASRSDGIRRFAAACSVLVGASLVLPGVRGMIAMGDSSVQYAIDALPAVFWTIALALCLRPGNAFGGGEAPVGGGLAVRRYWLAAAACFAASMIGLVVWGRSALLENAAGVSLLLITLWPADTPLLGRVGKLPPLAFGIYLSHMLPIKLCDSLAAHWHLARSWQLDLGDFLFSAVAATLIAYLLYQSRWTRWLAA